MVKNNEKIKAIFNICQNFLLNFIIKFGRQVVRFLACQREVSIIIYKVDRLGDWLLAEPTIRCVIAEAQLRGASVVVLASKETASYRQWRPLPCKVVEIPFSASSFNLKVRKVFYFIYFIIRFETNQIIFLRHTPDRIRDLTIKYARAKKCYALSSLLNRKFHCGTEASIPASSNCIPWEIFRHREILKNAGYLNLTLNELIPSISVVSSPLKSTVIFAPLGSTRERDWPIESWIELAFNLQSITSKIDLWVGPGQKILVEKLLSALSQKVASIKFEIITGPIPELALAITSSKVIITVETFTAHLAVALDARVIVLMGGGHYGEFGPWGRSNRQIWISEKLPCFNCNWICTQYAIDCIQKISANEVVKSIDKIYSKEISI